MIGLATEFDQFARRRVGQRVGALVERVVALGAGRQAETAVAALEQGRARKIGDDEPGVAASRAGGHAAVEARIGREDDVEHLALARIFGAVEIARPQFDADDPAGRDARQDCLKRFRLGARPGAVEHDIARRPGKAANVIIALLQREARHAARDVERAARREGGEESGIVARAARRLRGRGGVGPFAHGLLDGQRRRHADCHDRTHHLHCPSRIILIIRLGRQGDFSSGHRPTDKRLYQWRIETGRRRSQR